MNLRYFFNKKGNSKNNQHQYPVSSNNRRSDLLIKTEQDTYDIPLVFIRKYHLKKGKLIEKYWKVLMKVEDCKKIFDNQPLIAYIRYVEKVFLHILFCARSISQIPNDATSRLVYNSHEEPMISPTSSSTHTNGRRVRELSVRGLRASISIQFLLLTQIGFSPLEKFLKHKNPSQTCRSHI